MTRRHKLLFIAPAAILGILLVMTIGGQAVRLLWNWLLPPLFGWREVTFWQALGLLVLCRLLFGGSGFLRSRRSRFGRHMSGRWERMTPEERERFREGIRGRCGVGEAGPVTGPDM
jgi:hypothetical protein